MSTERIDVLAVLDRAIARNIERGAAKGSPSDRDLREARAAIAELIGAAAQAAVWIDEARLTASISANATLPRLESAIRRAGGA